MTSEPVHRPESARRRLAGITLAYVRLPHPGPIAIVLAVTAGFAMIAPGDGPSVATWVALLGAMAGGQLAIGAVNELVDVPDDARAKPWKPIPSGLVGVDGARAMTAIGLVAMIAGSATLGPWSLALCSLGTGMGLLYDLRLKRTPFSWLPYLVALPLIPIWVWTALDVFDPALLALYPLGALSTIAIHLAQSLPDVDGDRAAGIRSPTTLLGTDRSLHACWALGSVAPIAAFFLAEPLGARLGAVAPAAIGTLHLVVSGVVVGLVSRPLAVRACFPCLAIGTAALGLGWVLGLR